MIWQEEERLYYYEPNPKYVFKTLEEKRAFKRRVRESLELLGYYHDRDFLRDIYFYLEEQDLKGLVEHLNHRLVEAERKMKKRDKR